MEVNIVDPLSDERWSEFVERNPRSSVFHHVGWLNALWRTYNYKPIAFTTSHPGEPLANGLVFCEIRSWMLGRRLVSLPFSDHCDLLADSAQSRADLLERLAGRVGGEFKYAEIRSVDPLAIPPDGNWRPGERFVHHTLSLEPSTDDLYRNFHVDCIQRKIRRAEKEDLHYSKGCSEELLRQFYGLLLRTRRRHRIPPQPLKWFQNLMAFMGDQLTIRLVSKDAHPTAAIVTLSHQGTTTYKYGCSDERCNRYGGMPFLFWKIIEEERTQGKRLLDLGRSEISNSGLVQFKNRLGAKQNPMNYYIYSRENGHPSRSLWIAHLASRIMPRLPSAALHLPRTILAAPGSFLYKHMD